MPTAIKWPIAEVGAVPSPRQRTGAPSTLITAPVAPEATVSDLAVFTGDSLNVVGHRPNTLVESVWGYLGARSVVADFDDLSAQFGDERGVGVSVMRV